MVATLLWLSDGAGAEAQDFNFTNQQSGLWSDVNVWVNGAASAPTNGGGTNYIINFVNDAADFSTNDLSAGGLTNFYLNQLNFEGAARTYLMTMGSGVSNFVFSFNNGLPQINQDTWATSVISTVGFILDTNLLVGGTGGGAPLTGSILTFSNRVSGKGKIIMSGAFTLRLAASNSYMGGTILSNGIIQLANSNALSTGSTYLIQVYGNNAALDLGGADIANATAGAGSKTVMISGMGLGPNTGIIYNSGSSMTAKGLRNVLLGSDSAIGQDGGGRFDIIGTLNGGNHTLYKVGNNQVALTTTTIITNMVSVVVNEGRFTLVGASNLVSSGRTLFQVYTSGVFGVYGTLTFTNAIDMLGGTFENNGAGVTTWNGPIALNGDSNSFSAAGGDMFIGGDITGEGQLVKVGLHALTLSGVNTYSGGLFISSGMVVFTSASALPSTPAVPITLGAAGGVGATGIYNTVMDWLNSGKFASGTGGFVAMATNNSETIDFSVGGGYTDMFLASMDRISFVSFTGTITPVSTNYCLGAFGNMVLPMDNVLTNLYGSSANLIVGPAGVISSTGFVMLVGSNSYGGITTVNSNHTLSIGTTANIGGDGKTLVLNGGGLQIRGTVLTNSSTMTLRLVSGGDSTLDIDNNGNTFTLTNNLTGGGDLTKLGSGTLVLAGTNGLTGRLYIQEGVVRITNSWGLAAGSNVVVSGAALELGTNIERAVTGTGGNSRRIILNGSGIDNDGALRINSNFFQGVITNYASVRLASASRINADLGITLVQAGIVSNFTRLLTFGGYGNFVVTNVVGGSGGLAKDGSGMLTVGGKYTNTWGATFVNAGILRLDYGLVSGGLNANMVTNAAVTLGSAAFSITTGGTWVVNGPAAARTSTQCFNSLTIGPGNNRLIVSNGSGNVELNVSNVFRVIGSGVLDASFESGSRITSTLTNNYAGLLGFGTASTVGTNVLITINGVDWAMATNFAAGRATITPYDGYTDIQSGGTMVDGSNTNVRITDAGPGGFISLGAGVTRINSLIAADTTAVVTNDFAGQMLQMGQTAGILLTPTSGGLTLGSSANDGFLTAGGDTNTLGELILINYSDSALTVNSSIISNGMGAVTVTVAGNGSVNFMGNNAYNQTFIHGGNVVFYGTNNISGSSPLTVYQGEVTFAPGSVNSLAGGSIMVDGGGVLNINGSLALSGAGNPSFIVGYTAGSRAVATVSTNVTIGYQTHVGYNGAGALYLTNNGVMDVGDYFWLGKNAGSYGYLKLTNGTLLSGTKGGNLALEIGDEGVGVMDVLGGAYTNMGNYFMIARSDDSVGRGVLNVLGGRVVHAGNTDLRFGWTDTAGRGAYGVINIGGGGVLDAAAGGTTTKIDLNYSTGVSATSVVNVLSGGTLIANAIGATLDGTTVLSFNGGTLQAAAGTTLGSNFVSGLSGAYIYSDGATIDSGTNNITVSVSLLAPSGYGLTNIAVADMGIGYIGAPLVMITGGSGTGATAIAQVDLDPTSPTYQQITNILITSTGSGYYSNDMLNVTLLGGGAIQAGRVGAFTFGANSSGGGLIKNGAGALILTADNTYDGPTVINAGYLLVNSINQPGLTSLTLTNLQTAGIGLTVAMDQSFLTWLDSKVTAPTTNIVVLGADTTSNLAFTGVNTSNMFLGGIGATYSGSATWTDPTTLRLGGAPGQLTYASAIGGATNVIIGPVNGNASSTVLLGGSNSFISTIIVNSGSLVFTNDYNLGDPNNAVVLTNGGGLRIISSTAWNSTRTLNLTNGGGLITVDSGNTFYVNGSITGTGSLTKVGLGTLTMLANPSHTGGTILSNGTLSIGNGPNIGGTGASITFAGGTLQIRGVALNNLDAMAVNWEAFNGGLDINNDGNAFLVTNNINGGGALIKTGNGLLVLSGDNSGLQRLVVNGPLMITNGTALAGGSNVVLAGGSLQLASNIVTDPRLIVINGNGTGQANFSNKDGALRSVNGINTNTGPIVLASAARIRANAGSQLYLDGAITNGSYLLTFAGFGEIISRGGIYGTGGILKERAATVTLQNLVTNAYGNTAIDAGPLMFDYNAAGGTVVSNLVAPNSTLTLGASGFSLTTGGTLIVNGPSVGAMTQSFASVTINPGNNRITAVNNGGDIFLNLGNINRSVGSGILDLTLPGGAGEITSTLSNNCAGLLRLGAAGTGGTNVLITIDGTDWAMATNFGTGINKITNYVGYADIPDGSIITNGNMNMRIIGGGPGGNITLDSAVTTINSLVVTNAAATTIDLESAKTLRLGETGGILLTPTSGGLQIGASVNDGFLTAGGADNTAGELVFINNSANALTVDSALASNGTGALTVTVNGNGAVSFAGANNSFNRLYVNSGVVT
ncbi:MAG: autotransporter-associated beta strand repeat-containing protein, partial [Verrucomicrobiia bacterium]